MAQRTLLYTATPFPFMDLYFADIVDAALHTTLSQYLCTNRCHSRSPLWSAHASCRLNLCMPTSAWVAWLVAITLVLRLTGSIGLALSLASPIGTVPSALVNSYFFISYFVLAYTYLFSAKLRSGCLFKFRPCVDCLRPWTMIFP